MAIPEVRFPVICPVCQRESLSKVPVESVAAGLIRGLLELKGECDHGPWHASELECEQIREYLAAPILEIDTHTFSHENNKQRGTFPRSDDAVEVTPRGASVE